MKQELTNAEIARVFAMYIDIEVINPRFPYSRISYDNMMCEWFGASFYDRNTFFSDRRILLTPLPSITDEHAIEVATLFSKMAGSGVGTFYYNVRYVDKIERDSYKIIINYDTGEILYIYIDTGEVFFNTKSAERVFLFGKLTYEPRELLIKKGYAVPLFFGSNHWANGKNAIELNIAIDKTT
jgi:hypothetical protein